MLRSALYASYHRIARMSRRSEERVTAPGRIVQVGIVVSVTLGIDTELTLNFQLFAFLFCLYLAARLQSLNFTPELAVSRSVPRFVTAGEPFSYTIEVRNLSARLETDLVVTDLPKLAIPDFEEYLEAAEPEERSRNAWDRYVGYHRYIWLARRKSGLVTEPVGLPNVPPGGTVSVSVEATTMRRGRVDLEAVMVSAPDPFGLCHGTRRYPLREQLLALPRRYPIPRDYVPPGGRHYQPGGVSSTWSVGESGEFVGLRDYRDGDSPRKIHWASTAKRARPVVKEYQDEFFVRQALILDTCTPNWQLLEEAVSVAASFAVTVDTNESLLDLVFLADGPLHVTAGRGTAHTEQLMEILAVAEPSGLSITALERHVMNHAARLSGAMVILCDWDESRATFMQHLRVRNIPLRVLLLAETDEPAMDLPADVMVLTKGRIEEGLAEL